MSLDSAQRKLIADFLSKFALALATAIAAKLFFNEEPLEESVAIAAIVMVIMFMLALIITRGTDNKPSTPTHTEVKKGIFHIQNAEIKGEGL